MNQNPDKQDRQPEPRLEQVQRWMQSVLMHRGGVAEGVDAPESRACIDISLRQLPQVINPSNALSSADRLEIYVNAYHARLMECLDEEFAVTRQAMGADLFSAVTFGYLQNQPSQSYTLNQLGARFAGYLTESRLHAADMPAGAKPSWPDFIIELATFERSLYEVYDGPGTERQGALDPERLAQIPPDRWDALRLIAAPCLRLHRFEHPVSEFWGASKDDLAPEVPSPAVSLVAIHRQDYVVQRQALSPGQFALLDAIIQGATLQEAISAAAQAESGFESQLAEWFAEWMSAGIFVDAELSGEHAELSGKEPSEGPSA